MFENCHRSCVAPFCVYVLWTGFSQDSFLVFFFLLLIWALFCVYVCTVLYCKRDFSRDFSLWGKRRTGMLGCLLSMENPSSDLGLFSFNSSV